VKKQSEESMNPVSTGTTQKRKLSPGLIVMLIAAIVLSVLALFLSVTLLSGCAHKSVEGAGPKHIFVFIGDGMGVNHLAATRYFQAARDGQAGQGIWKDSFDSFPFIGLMSTHSRSSVTDSAASITAMLTGEKTENGCLNYDPAKQENLTPFAAKAKNAGFSVGVITTTSVEHATPAGVYANSADRNDYDGIAPQGLVPNYLSFLGGGGFRTNPDAHMADAKQNGFHVLDGAAQIRAYQPDDAPVLALAHGGISDYEMAYEIDRLRAAQYGGDALAFSELFDAALQCVSQKPAFILFSEAAKIDMAAASGDLATSLYEVQALDDGVKQAVAFYREHPSDTLIIVLADHETGGLRLKTEFDFSKLTTQIASNERFSSIMGELIQSGGDFDAAKEKVTHYFGIEVSKLDDSTQNKLRDAFDSATKSPEKIPEFTYEVCQVLAQQARAGFETGSHTGSPVAVYAMGQGAETFSGVYDNTAIYGKLSALMGIQ
jgi:alkaline phosphatase